MTSFLLFKHLKRDTPAPWGINWVDANQVKTLMRILQEGLTTLFEDQL